jgi:hypothetical protein
MPHTSEYGTTPHSSQGIGWNRAARIRVRRGARSRALWRIEPCAKWGIGHSLGRTRARAPLRGEALLRIPGHDPPGNPPLLPKWAPASPESGMVGDSERASLSGESPFSAKRPRTRGPIRNLDHRTCGTTVAATVLVTTLVMVVERTREKVFDRVFGVIREGGAGVLTAGHRAPDSGAGCQQGPVIFGSRGSADRAPSCSDTCPSQSTRWRCSAFVRV